MAPTDSQKIPSGGRKSLDSESLPRTVSLETLPEPNEVPSGILAVRSDVFWRGQPMHFFALALTKSDLSGHLTNLIFFPVQATGTAAEYASITAFMEPGLVRTPTLGFLGFVLALALSAPIASACSRVTWLGPDGLVITGRSMDWPYPFNSTFFVIPRGTPQNGRGGVNSLTWTSKYGVVEVAGALNPGGPINGVFDGLNEKGLAANLLYLGEADFGPAPTSDKPRLSFGGWTEYLLSNFATVAEVVDAFKADPIYIVPINFGPGGAAHASIHMAISDASGDSAIIEYLNGKPVIHHGREYQVMTNSPTYDQQIVLNAYWKGIDRNKVLPGSIQSQDRFVRASYYLEKLPQTKDERQAMAGVFSVMRNVSVPWGQPDPDHPNLSPTYWRTGIDQTHLVYYFESALSPNIIWTNLTKIDFSPGSGVRSLLIEGNYELIGNVNAALRPSQPISFLAP